MIKIIYPSLKAQFMQIILLVVAIIIGTLLTVILPSLMGGFIDYLNKGIHDKTYINNFAFIFILSTLLLLIANYFENILRIYTNNLVTTNFYFWLITHIEKLPLLFFENNDSTEQNTIINNDCNEVSSFTLSLLTLIPTRVIMFLTLIVIIFIKSTLMGIFTILLIPTYVFCIIYFGKKIVKENDIFIREQSRFFGLTTDRIRKMKFIKIHSLYEKYASISKEAFSDYFESCIKYSKLSYYFTNASYLINQFGTLLLFIFSGYLISVGKLTVGEFIVLNSYFIIVISTFTYFVGFSRDYQDVKASYERIMVILNTPKEESGTKNIQKVTNIELKDVILKHGKQSKYNIEFQVGYIYCIIGENGIGKTTLIDSIIGLVPTHGGTLFFNRVAISEIDTINLRKNCISYMEQTPTLIEGSIIENIRLDNDVMENSDCFENVHAKFSKFKDSDDCELNNVTLNYSGGERANIGFYRALYKNASVIILDEPTASLDAVTVNKILSELTDVKCNKIVIIISHDKRVIEFSDILIDLSAL